MEKKTLQDIGCQCVQHITGKGEHSSHETFGQNNGRFPGKEIDGDEKEWKSVLLRVDTLSEDRDEDHD